VTTRAEYTDEEWQLLSMSPWVVGFAVAFGDPGGSLRETFFLASATTSVRERYPGNELLASLWTQRPGATTPPAPVAEANPGSAEDIPLDRAVETCRSVSALLEERSTLEEAEGFRRFLADVALGVANAAGGGLLGGGARISAAERAAVEAIRDALGLGPLPAGNTPETASTPRLSSEPPAPDTIRGVTGVPAGPIDPE
jgi:hypothetical protein